MRLIYRLTASEFVAAQNLAARRKPVQFVCLIIIHFLMPVFGMFMVYGNYVQLQRRELIWGFGEVLNLLFLAGFFVIFPVWYHLYLRYRYRSTRVSEGDSILDLEDDHIECELPGLAKSRIEWAAVKKFIRNKKLILIYISKGSFIIVPCRVLNGEQQEELLSLLQRHSPSH